MKMSKFKKIDRQACRDIRVILDNELPPVLADSGLSVDVGNASYNDTGVTFKIKLTLEGVDPRKEEFERYKRAFNLKSEHYGAEFTVKGEKFRLVAVKVRSPKWPIVGENASGQTYKFKESVLKQIITLSD